MTTQNLAETLIHIDKALERSDAILQEFVGGKTEVFRKSGGDPVTAADHAVNDLLRSFLPRNGEGWLSEETTDDLSRLQHERVWVVDPLDGTKEFVAGIPEWCVSIAFVHKGQPLAGGILNPQTNEKFLGASGLGVTYNGESAKLSTRTSLDGALVLASRSEVNRGEWERFMGSVYTVQAMGSVAYKLARVSAGLADATWTLVPKHEWDVAAGAALVLAAGGTVYSPEGGTVTFNNKNPKLTGFVAHSREMTEAVRREIERAGH
jgi:myo-inositol-1(or 4)-monophosphatase